MLDWLVAPFLLAGFAAGFGIWHFFRKMPTSWLLDYGETEISPELRARQALSIWPDAVLLALADGLVFALAWLMLGPVLQLPAVLIAAQPLLLVMVADFKTRIIPDQFTLAVLPCALLLWLADSLAGNPAWLKGLLLRALAGLIGGGLLFLCGWIAEKLLHKEAMGMGDVKLLAACGLLTSLPYLPMLIVMSFLSAALIAVPLLIRRLRNPEAGSDMAFGPYIALAALLVMLLAKPIVQLWDVYVGLIL